MSQQNFLIGRGELLASDVPYPRRGNDKAFPYTMEEALLRLTSEFESLSKELDTLPQDACPDDIAVEMFTLHPGFLAKSYFPDALFRTLGLVPLGSRNVKILPKKSMVKKVDEAETEFANQIFVAGRRSTWRTMMRTVRALPVDSTAAVDFTKIESVSKPMPFADGPTMLQGSTEAYFEVGLHKPEDIVASEMVTLFSRYAESCRAKVHHHHYFETGGLLFVAVSCRPVDLARLGLFAFVRVVRRMPKLRSIVPPRRSAGAEIQCQLSTEPPVASDVKVAIMDGGLPQKHPIGPWLESYIRLDETAHDDMDASHHGLAVTSAFLFGSIAPGGRAERPFARVSHLRVLDSETASDDPLLLYRTLGLIEQVLLSREYQFLNLSLGPDLPIEDAEVHAWTSVIDDLLSDGETFLTVAAGNNGQGDRETGNAGAGNARIQVPADCVNALAVGAATTKTEVWERAAYSAIGPGRSPGLVKPDLMSFGGSPGSYFHVLQPDSRPLLSPELGTSFAAPLLLRSAVGVRALMGQQLSVLAIKAVLVHSAEENGLPQNEVGWGRVPEELARLITVEDGAARIVYQGVLKPGKVLRAQIPLPVIEELAGDVSIAATFTFATQVDPQDSGAYTRAGLGITFRPHSKKFKPKAADPTSKPFFGNSMISTEEDLRRDASKWETVLNAGHNFRSTTLHRPVFDIHYAAREHGGAASTPPKIPYALVVTIRTPKFANLNETVLRTFPQLTTILPRVSVEVST